MTRGELAMALAFGSGALASGFAARLVNPLLPSPTSESRAIPLDLTCDRLWIPLRLDELTVGCLRSCLETASEITLMDACMRGADADRTHPDSSACVNAVLQRVTNDGGLPTSLWIVDAPPQEWTAERPSPEEQCVRGHDNEWRVADGENGCRRLIAGAVIAERPTLWVSGLAPEQCDLR